MHDPRRAARRIEIQVVELRGQAAGFEADARSRGIAKNRMDGDTIEPSKRDSYSTWQC